MITALLYEKELALDNLNIKYNFYFDDSMAEIDNSCIKRKNIIDTTKLLAIFIDNAIDELSKIQKGYLSLIFEKSDDELIIKIGNETETDIDEEKIYECSFSTKDSKRGHGLSHAKLILNENVEIKNEVKYKNNYFIQTLKIKLKKTDL